MKNRLNNIIKKIVLLGALALTASFATAQTYSTTEAVAGRWSEARINKWYDAQPWLVGCNYTPATAINQIEFWQASTWDPKQIKKELKWAEELGMNTLRVYLHDLVWADDEQGLYKRMDQFLSMCEKRGIKPWFVFFDDCHFPLPKLGVQPLPVPAFHNSGWVNCPARDVAVRYARGTASEAEKARLKGYVQRTMERFADDERVLLWELYNEPGRGAGTNGDMATTEDIPAKIGDMSAQLVYDSWVWAREVNPSQPITSCTLGSVGKKNIAINHINSDLFSIHSYDKPAGLREKITRHEKENRPVLVSEWLARTAGSTPQDCLPVMKELRAAAVQWGFVAGKSATIWPWTSRTGRDVDNERKQGNVVANIEDLPEPELWFHDLLRLDGTPYSEEEVAVFKGLTK